MRTPTELLARFGRQLLVEGAELSAQQALARWAFVAATDATPPALAAAEVAARYAAGGGFGRMAGAIGQAAEIDTAVQILPDRAPPEPPVAHLYVASRVYGMSVDIIATADDPGWAAGRSADAQVCTAAFDFGRKPLPEDAPFVGAAAADLLLSHLLGLSPLPSGARFCLPDDGEPSLHLEAARPGAAARSAPAAEVDVSMAALARAPGVYAAIVADCLANYPNEACGFVVRKPDGRLRAAICRNEQDRYHEQDPRTYRRTARTAFKLNDLKLARAVQAGDEVVCIYHSHCDAGAYFSEEDIACALYDGAPLYPGVAYLVVSVVGGELRGAELHRFDADRGTYLAERELLAHRMRDGEERLEAVRRAYREAVRGGNGAFTWDLDRDTVRFEPAWKAQLGYTDAALRDDPESWFSRVHPQDIDRLRRSIRALIADRSPLVQQEYRIQHRDGTWVWVRCTAGIDRTGGPEGVITGTQQDITATKLAELRISYAEQHDHLTGLLRVQPFVRRLDEALQESRPGVLVACDIVGFRDVNERFDRLTGDDALVLIAGVLEDQLPDAKVIGRLSGDDFGFVLEAEMATARERARSLLGELRGEAFVARNGEHFALSASFALGERPADCPDGSAWLDHVYSALHGEPRAGVALVPSPDAEGQDPSGGGGGHGRSRDAEGHERSRDAEGLEPSPDAGGLDEARD